jgi:hypothetical protein
MIHIRLHRSSAALPVANRSTILMTILMLAVLAPSCKDKASESKAQPTAATPAAHKHTDGESCFIEDPSKREPGRLWCKEHSRYEDRCWECQPQLRDSKRPYCDEHGLYEDECFLCDPSRVGTTPGAEPVPEEPTP